MLNRPRRLSPRVLGLIPKTVDMKCIGVSNWLKRTPSRDAEYNYLPTFDFDGNMFSLVDNYLEGKRVTPVEVADYYFKSVYTMYGPQPFFVMLKCKEALDIIDGLGRDFVIDTLNFVATGKRAFSHPVWRGLLDDEVRSVQKMKSQYKAEPLSLPQDYLKALDGISEVDFYLRWVNQREGLTDLIFSYQTFLEPWVLEEPPLEVFVVDSN